MLRRLDTIRLRHVVLVAFLIRLAYVLLVTRGMTPVGDEVYYVSQGEALAHGKGFAAPLYFAGVTPSADHPPINALLMAIGPLLASGKAMLFGLPLSIFLQRLTQVVVGTLTVAVVGRLGVAIVGRSTSNRLAHRTGILAAMVAALSPSLWINDGILMAESVTALTVVATLLMSVWAWDRGQWWRWALLGGMIGMAALARAELVGLLLVMALPMLVLRYRSSACSLFINTGSCMLAGAAVCALWIVPNMVRFQEPTLFSTNDGLTLLGSNCPPTYSGPDIGGWRLDCLRLVDTNHNGVDDFTDLEAQSPFDTRSEDQSQISARYKRAGIAFAKAHASELPRVIVARVGRTWGFWNPALAVRENEGEGRKAALSWAAWLVHWLMLPAAIAGVLVLRRSRRPTWPFISQAVLVTAASAVANGLPRFRISWDVAACVLVAVAFAHTMSRREVDVSIAEG